MTPVALLLVLLAGFINTCTVIYILIPVNLHVCARGCVCRGAVCVDWVCGWANVSVFVSLNNGV